MAITRRRSRSRSSSRKRCGPGLRSYGKTCRVPCEKGYEYYRGVCHKKCGPKRARSRSSQKCRLYYGCARPGFRQSRVSFGCRKFKPAPCPPKGAIGGHRRHDTGKCHGYVMVNKYRSKKRSSSSSASKSRSSRTKSRSSLSKIRSKTTSSLGIDFGKLRLRRSRSRSPARRRRSRSNGRRR